MRSFFRALPKFPGAMLAEAGPMFEGAHYGERLRWIEASSDEAVSVFLNTAAKALELPELAIEIDPARLRRAEHLHDGSFWVIATEGG
jgi:hypothetical protein